MTKTKRTYFMTMKLKTGEFVDIVYESASRKGTEPHDIDLYFATKDLGVDWNYKFNHDTATFSYILNKKNEYEQCFGDHRIIDRRGKRG